MRTKKTERVEDEGLLARVRLPRPPRCLPPSRVVSVEHEGGPKRGSAREEGCLRSADVLAQRRMPDSALALDLAFCQSPLK